MPMDLRVHDKFESVPVITAWDTTLLEGPARLAVAFIERWGMVAALPDAEDSAGRQRSKLQTPAEVVERACETAALAFAEFEKRGWIKTSPTFDEADKLLDERPERNGKNTRSRRSLPDLDPSA